VTVSDGAATSGTDAALQPPAPFPETVTDATVNATLRVSKPAPGQLWTSRFCPCPPGQRRRQAPANDRGLRDGDGGERSGQSRQEAL